MKMKVLSKGFAITEALEQIIVRKAMPFCFTLPDKFPPQIVNVGSQHERSDQSWRDLLHDIQISR